MKMLPRLFHCQDCLKSVPGNDSMLIARMGKLITGHACTTQRRVAS